MFRLPGPSHLPGWNYKQENSLRCEITVKDDVALQAEILCVSAPSNIDIYIIESPLNCVPTAVTNGWLWMDLDSGEFP
jgi:hypothetical protein